MAVSSHVSICVALLETVTLAIVLVLVPVSAPSVSANKIL